MNPDVEKTLYLEEHGTLEECLALLPNGHPSSLVREGALLGLYRLLEEHEEYREQIIHCLQEVCHKDNSKGCRKTAENMLWIC